MACASTPSSIVTPQGRAAFQADQVLIRVENVQDAVIAAATPDAAGRVGIEKPTADIIVGFTRDAALTIRQTPNGWLPTVRTAWAAAKTRIPPATLASVQGYIIAIETLLAGAAGAEGNNDAANRPKQAHPVDRLGGDHSRDHGVAALAA
jgi:hypothetical protein